MLFLLDTPIVSELRKPQPHAGVLSWTYGLAPSDIAIAAVTAGEMQAGIERARRSHGAKAGELDRWLGGLCAGMTVLPADDAVFRLWARLSASRPAHSFADALIAATALHHGLTVATRNAHDFTPYGVLVANPFGRVR